MWVTSFRGSLAAWLAGCELDGAGVVIVMVSGFQQELGTTNRAVYGRDNKRLNLGKEMPGAN
ncbi:hypothetical protein ACLKOZ_03240 [Arthrobacter sp. R4]